MPARTRSCPHAQPGFARARPVCVPTRTDTNMPAFTTHTHMHTYMRTYARAHARAHSHPPTRMDPRFRPFRSADKTMAGIKGRIVAIAHAVRPPPPPHIHSHTHMHTHTHPHVHTHTHTRSHLGPGLRYLRYQNLSQCLRFPSVHITWPQACCAHIPPHAHSPREQGKALWLVKSSTDGILKVPDTDREHGQVPSAVATRVLEQVVQPNGVATLEVMSRQCPSVYADRCVDDPKEGASSIWGRWWMICLYVCLCCCCCGFLRSTLCD